MENKSLKLEWAFLGFFLFLVSCGSGTEVGNPSTKRIATGRLLTTSQSCPSANGPVSLVFRDETGQNIVSVDPSAQNDFSTLLDRSTHYEIRLLQGTTVCGYLYQGASQSNPGLHSVLGKGTSSITLGSVNDEGNGVFTAENDASDYCDDDGDDVPDSEDQDADNDGNNDTDDGGYINWFQESDVEVGE